MWTATVKEKGEVAQGAYVVVDFTDGARTVTEQCIPQDLDGFRHWVRSRLASFNVKTDLDAKYAVGSTVVVTETLPTPTADEIARNEWFNDFRRMERVQKLVDLGIVLATNAKVVALRDRLKTNLRVEYIDAL